MQSLRRRIWWPVGGVATVVALTVWPGPQVSWAVVPESPSGPEAVTGPRAAGGQGTEEEPALYDPAGKRDPFRPYVQTLDRPALVGQITPLQQFELSQLRLVAIITDPADPQRTRAVVEDSAGLGYIIRRGTPIGRMSGRVTAIERDRIVIEEWPANVFGEQRRTVVVKELDAGEEAKR